MTDREALRRLAVVVSEFASRCEEFGIEDLVTKLLTDLSEPAAPTEGTTLNFSSKLVAHIPNTAPTVTPVGVDPQGKVLCAGCYRDLIAERAQVEEFSPTVTRDDIPTDGSPEGWQERWEAHFKPTVTREQAERVKSALAYYFDAKDYGAMGPDWPAFFRAVADALEDK